MRWKIPLTVPDLGPEEVAAVTKVLNSKWLTMGPVTEEFEHAFAAKMSVKHAIAVANGTAALHLANVALGVSAGTEVVCPALSFVATANGTRYTGAKVVFADVLSDDDLTISPADVEAKLSPASSAITVVHYAGFPCHMTEIMDVAKRYNLNVIEDCAHSPFAWIPSSGRDRQYMGGIGHVGCFSFFGNKNMTTGEGGMITTSDDDLAARIRLLRSHGMTTSSYERDRGRVDRYDVVALGYNYRLDEIRAAIGLCQLAKIDRLNDKRRQVFAWYREALRDVEDVSVPFSKRDLAHSVCHIMPLLVRNDRYALIKQALRKGGVQTSKHYELINDLTLYKSPGETARARSYELLTLPLAPDMTRDDVALIAELISGTEVSPH